MRMIVLVLMALVGAVLGALVRPCLLAVPVAAALAASARAVIGLAAPIAVDDDTAPEWAKLCLSIISDPLGDYLPLLAAAAGAALIAGLLAMLVDKQAPRHITLEEATALQRRVRGGRYVRADDMMGKHSLLNRSEARLRSILGL